MALDVPLFFEKGEKGVNGARSKIDSEVLAEAGDDLISVHGLAFQKLEDNEV